MTLAHEHSTEFTRLDLNAHMEPRRRLRHPTSATTTSTTLQNPGEQPPPVTFSRFVSEMQSTLLGGFDPPGLSYPTSSNFMFESMEAGPSRVDATPHDSGAVSGVIIESGWSRDVFGQEQYVGHGKIEEVGDDDMGDVMGDVIVDRDSFETPRGRPAAVALSYPGGHEFHMNDLLDDEDRNIPSISTPPPRPKSNFKRLPSLRQTLSHRSLNTPSPHTAPVRMVPSSPGAGPSSSTVVSDPYEVALVQENLDLLSSSQADIIAMMKFFRNFKDHDFSQHIDTCSKLTECLESLRDTLATRKQMGAEEWNVRSSSWHQKYSKRLLSLRLTLQRLGRMRQMIQTQSFRPPQHMVILTKLKQHEAKLADLASKYSAAFSRLKLRHLHFLLTKAHSEANKLRAQKTRLISRPSFERRWRDGKTFRAGLRGNFHELRQELSNLQRNGRNLASA